MINNTWKLFMFSDNKKEMNAKTASSIDLQSPSSVRSSETQETHVRSSMDSIHTNPEVFCSFSYINERNYKGNSFNKTKKMFRTNSSGSISEAEYKWNDSETTVWLKLTFFIGTYTRKMVVFLNIFPLSLANISIQRHLRNRALILQYFKSMHEVMIYYISIQKIAE